MLKSMGIIEFGVVHWFSHDQGFGFITPDDGGPDIFVDLSEVVRGRHRPLQGGQCISYRLGGAQTTVTRRIGARAVMLATTTARTRRAHTVSSTIHSPRLPTVAASGLLMICPPIALVASLVELAERWLPTGS